MAECQFIFQGLTEDVHRDAVAQVVDIRDLAAFTVAVAFLTESGVGDMETHLIQHAAATTAYIGIANGVTTTQGVLRLFNTGCRVFTVNTGTPTIVEIPNWMRRISPFIQISRLSTPCRITSSGKGESTISWPG